MHQNRREWTLKQVRDHGRKVGERIKKEPEITRVRILDGPRGPDNLILTTSIMFDYQWSRYYLHLDDGDAFLSTSISMFNLDHVLGRSTTHSLPDDWKKLIREGKKW